MTTASKPSITELQGKQQAMDGPPWVDVHPAVVFQDGPEPLYIADCRGCRPHDNAAGIAALINAAPVLLEIVAAALAWRAATSTETDNRAAIEASRALCEALGKVRR